jgi:hypothetical protein
LLWYSWLIVQEDGQYNALRSKVGTYMVNNNGRRCGSDAVVGGGEQGKETQPVSCLPSGQRQRLEFSSETFVFFFLVLDTHSVGLDSCLKPKNPYRDQ